METCAAYCGKGQTEQRPLWLGGRHPWQQDCRRCRLQEGQGREDRQSLHFRAQQVWCQIQAGCWLEFAGERAREPLWILCQHQQELCLCWHGDGPSTQLCQVQGGRSAHLHWQRVQVEALPDPSWRESVRRVWRRHSAGWWFPGHWSSFCRVVFVCDGQRSHLCLQAQQIWPVCKVPKAHATLAKCKIRPLWNGKRYRSKRSSCGLRCRPRTWTE
mmetsp:Transcript_4357/g.13175  ORF Transcript_4357/g.13175 Transcript_4357/m.13175 type:complete len:215 (-) Transcript_4357:807-1451(-)